MRRHSSGLPIQTGAKSFTNFLADRHTVDAADLTITFVRGISHDIYFIGEVNRRS
jgi:hypothetical protein